MGNLNKWVKLLEKIYEIYKIIQLFFKDFKKIFLCWDPLEYYFVEISFNDFKFINKVIQKNLVSKDDFNKYFLLPYLKICFKKIGWRTTILQKTPFKKQLEITFYFK